MYIITVGNTSIIDLLMRDINNTTHSIQHKIYNMKSACNIYVLLYIILGNTIAILRMSYKHDISLRYVNIIIYTLKLTPIII